MEKDRFAPTGTFIEFEWFSFEEDGVLDFTIDEFGGIHYSNAEAASDSPPTGDVETRPTQLAEAAAPA